MTDNPLINDREARQLITATIAGHDPDGADEEQIRAVYDWAHQTRTDGLLLEMVLDGQLIIRVESDGELRFKAAGGAR